MATRAYGPYERVTKSGIRYKVVLRDSSGGPATTETFATEAGARNRIAECNDEIKEAEEVRTIDEAIEAYAGYLRDDKGNGERSVEETPKKVRRFFAPDVDQPLEVLTQRRCERLYDRLREQKRTKSGPGGKRIETDKPIAVATHRQILLEARSFTKWCCKKRWLRENPLEGVEGKGERNHGKKQLRIDDAREWTAKAFELAEAGDVGAVAALMTYFMANRASEITLRKVGDVDDGGRVLWIEEGKTDESNGAMLIPDDLQPLIRKLVKGRDRAEWLFPAEPKKDGTVGPHWRDWPRENVQRICKLAGVPEVCAHSMRGLHSTVLYEEGAAGNIIMRSMRHREESTTRTSYATKGSQRAGARKRTLKVLQGGR